MEKNLRPRVLIVDDMRVNRLILATLLDSHGVESDLAESGTECLEMCRRTAYDLILLDHRMPIIDGVETLVQLKEMFRRTGHEVPVICHTTEDAGPNIALYKAAGFSDVLLKPIRPEELAQMLKTYLPDSELDAVEKVSAEQERLQAEVEKLPQWLKDFKGLDTAFGLENCSTVEDYLDALTIFSASVTTKAAEIEKILAEENYNLYALKLGSLSAMATLVGAKDISSTAAELEYSAKHGDTSIVKEITPQLLENYRRYAALLARLKEGQQ